MSKELIKKGYNNFGIKYYESRKYKSGPSYFYNENLEMPTTLKFLGNIQGKKILDLGCGPGIYADILYKKGAIIKGIDFSEELVKIAKEKVPGVDFCVGDAEKLPYNDKEFDIVFSALMMGHLASWDKVLSEVNRVLKTGGIFIFSQHNPVTEKMSNKKWFFKTFRVLNDYFNEGKIVRDWKEKSNISKMVHYHKTYARIIRLLIEHGFYIIDYEDCKPLSSSKKIFPKEYKKTINIPHFCVWKLKKK